MIFERGNLLRGVRGVFGVRVEVSIVLERVL